MRFINRNIFLAPRRKAFTLRHGRVRHAGSRIDLHQAGLDSPTENAAHGVEEMARLERCIFGSLIAPSDDGGSCDLTVRLSAGRLQNALQDVFALSPCWQ
jgi:hypothetical protein